MSDKDLEIEKRAVLKNKLEAALDIILNPQDYERNSVITWALEVKEVVEKISVDKQDPKDRPTSIGDY